MLELYGDFNGLWTAEDGGTLLCLSHKETLMKFDGEEIDAEEGTVAVAREQDADENGQRDDLLAQGTILRSPDWLQCRGSKWCLKIDDRGIYHQSDSE